MKNTTLGYIEYNNCYLMLYRDIDKSDGSLGKWLGVGGKLEEDESPDDCFIREAFEETGIKLSEITRRAVVDFKSEKYESERMYLYTAKVNSEFFDPSCNEGLLKWIPKNEINNLNMWEGDHVFLERLLSEKALFHLSLIYGGESGDELTKVIDDRLVINEPVMW